MLTPQKHLNLDVSVLRISALSLKEIRKRRTIEFNTLHTRICRRTGADGSLLFLPALNLLFLLGKIDYHIKNDSIEYIED